MQIVLILFTALMFMLLISLNHCNCQSLEIINLDSGSGVFMMKTEPTEMIEYYENTIHVINLTQYDLAFERIKMSINSIPAGVPLELKLKVNQLERELTFLGHRRTKRGLLNFLG